MNYRHIYHAGNFADVLKHAVLARLIRYMQKKDKAFRVLDTHAGIGLYDLSARGSAEDRRMARWHRPAAGRGTRAEGPEAAGALSRRPSANSIRRAASASIPARRSLPACCSGRRTGCRRWNCIPEDYDTLHRLFEGDFQSPHHRARRLAGARRASAAEGEARHRAGRSALRGSRTNIERLVDGLAKAWRRFPGGTYCLWYPLKKGAPIKRIPRGAAGARNPEDALRRTDGAQRPRHDRTDGLGPDHRQPALSR